MEYIQNCGIATCTDEGNSGDLNSSIRQLWSQCLKSQQKSPIEMPRKKPAPKGPTDPNDWFKHFVFMIDKFAEEGGRLPLLCRHIAEAEGVVYPEFNDINKKDFIQDLEAPDGSFVHYDLVFERAIQNVIKAWEWLGDAIAHDDPNRFALANGDLDSGCGVDNKLIFEWRTV